MSTPNTASRVSFLYQAVEGTGIIVDAATQTYLFGIYDPGLRKWNYPEHENETDKYYNQNSRTPLLVDKAFANGTFRHTFNPTTAQFMNMFLGNPADAAPDTIAPITPAQQKPSMDIRVEERAGTNPYFQQLETSKCVSMFGRAQRGARLIAELGFEFEVLKDQDDEPILTTAPIHPETIDKAYHGQPEVTRDWGGGGAATIPQVWKAEWLQTLENDKAKSSDGTSENIEVYKFSEGTLILYAVFLDNTDWDDFIDRTTQDFAVKVFKRDNTNYVQPVFENCHNFKFGRSGVAYNGAYESILTLQCEKITANFIHQGANFSTHFPAVI